MEWIPSKQEAWYTSKKPLLYKECGLAIESWKLQTEVNLPCSTDISVQHMPNSWEKNLWWKILALFSLIAPLCHEYQTSRRVKFTEVNSIHKPQNQVLFRFSQQTYWFLGIFLTFWIWFKVCLDLLRFHLFSQADGKTPECYRHFQLYVSSNSCQFSLLLHLSDQRMIKHLNQSCLAYRTFLHVIGFLWNWLNLSESMALW